MKKGFLKRALSFLLSAAVTATSVPSTVFAEAPETGNGRPDSVVTEDKGSIPVEEGWEETYPYGAFLFDNSDAAVEEGGEEITIPLYRLGGTSGRVTAYVVYSPVVSYLNDETPAYGTAAGNEDVKITVEDELPIAKYQAIGKAPEPEASGVRIIEEEYTGEDAKEGDKVLFPDASGDSYQWYIFADESWSPIEGATEKEFVIGSEGFEENDFRCVYTIGEESFSTDSYRGEPYIKPEEEELPEMPEELDLNPERSFFSLETDKENPYAATVFAVTFAEGEWKKEIRVSAFDNDKPDPLRFGTFTILDHVGGEIFKDASTVTLQVHDNDEEAPYTIGFEKKEITADKAKGKAVLKLKRNGGGKDVITIDYATVDGTALAGKDYKSVKGTAFFYADIDEVTIEIPLLDDRTESREKLDFTLSLLEVKGDSNGLCTLSENEAKISLINSGTGAENKDSVTIATAGDLSEDADTAPVSGKQIIVPEEELLRGEIAGFDGRALHEELSGLDTYNYGQISFRGDNGGVYWDDYAYVAGKAKNDITGWSAGSACGNGWSITSDGDSEARLDIPYMSQMYKRFNGSFKHTAGWCSGWYASLGRAFGWGRLNPNGQSQTPEPSNVHWDGLTRCMRYYPSWSISKSWSITDSMSGVSIGTTYHTHKSLDDVRSEINSGYLTRRTFNNNLNLRIHTANDGESGNGNVATAPKNGAAFKEKSGVYTSMKPEVVIEAGNGGVNKSGKLYVGSRVRVSLKSVDSFKPYTGSVLNSAVYVTRSNGELLPASVVEAGKDGVYYVTLVWDNMTADDISDTYTINIVMTRRQELELNLRPSVEREAGDELKIDTGKIGDAWDAFWNSGSDHITIGVSEALKDAPHFAGNKIKEISVQKSDWISGDKNPLKLLGTYDNIQYINFNRSTKDRIVYNKKSYKGNARINLTVEDLAFAKLSFAYYQYTFLDKPSTMEASVNRVEVYYDGDGDGQIAGSYDENTGYFVLEEGTKDEFLMYLEEGGAYDETTFEPVSLGNGRFAQYFAKVYYTMTPRYLVAPKGASGYAQVLPAFVTSVTNESKKSQLTEEQKSYRYVLSGKNENGVRTSDNHIMYGEAATGINYVDVPLGGDHSPVTQKDDGEYVWTPQFVGNLIYPFSDPEPIHIEHSLAGENIPLADISIGSDGKVKTTAAGKANLNGYLGSFAADTTIALCVTVQQHTADELAADQSTAATLQPENSALTDRSAAPDGSWKTKTDPPSMGKTGFDTSGSGQPYDSFNTDYNVDLASSTESFQGLATVYTGKNKITIAIALPIYSKNTDHQSSEKSQGKLFPNTVGDPFNANAAKIGGYMDGMKNGNYDKILKQLKDGGYKEGNLGNLKTLKSSSSNFTVSFSAAFTLKYDTRDNVWYFQEFAFGAAASFTYRYEVRLEVCPIFYGYISATIGITVSSGGTINRIAQEGQSYINNREKTLNKGAQLIIPTAYVNMNIRFKGKLYFEVLDSENATAASADTNKGYLNSDGTSDIQLQFKKSEGSFTFDNASTTKYIRILALENTTVSDLKSIESVKTEVSWSGVNVEPKLNMEFGIGVGVEGLKAEAFVKLLVSANIGFGTKQDDGSRKGIECTSAEFSLALAFRAVLLMMSWEIDAIGIKAKYEKDSGWTTYYTKLGKDYKLDSFSASWEEWEDKAVLSLPEDVSKTQTIYSSQVSEDELSSLDAYSADDPNVPFALSGYNSSGEAVRLADGLVLGYDYKVVEAGGANYVIYTMGRPDGKGMDTSMLALSRLVMTAENRAEKAPENSSDEGSDKESGGNTINGLGLMNPLDWVEVTDENGKTQTVLKNPSERSEDPYILVDLKEENGRLVDDGTGDLEFDVKVIGDEIHVAWVSYKDPNPDPDPGDTEQVFKEAARNTVIKLSFYDVSKTEGFSASTVISDPDAGAAVYAPAIVNDGIVAFAEANHVTDDERTKLVDAYKKKVEDEVPISGEEAEDSKSAKAAIRANRLTTYTTTLDAKGDSSTIYLYDEEGGGLNEIMSEHDSSSASSDAIEPIDKLRGLEMTEDDMDIVFLGYTTWKENVSSAAEGEEYDSGMYLVSVLRDESGDTEFDETDMVSSRGLDGHAYFDAFELYAERLYDEGSGQEDDSLLILGQNGSVYTIPFYYDDNGNMTVGTLQATKFYGGSADNGEKHKAAYAFGQDGMGNLSTVYINKVENTTNTGLYISRYDSREKAWGQGVLLAMRNMDVYEDAAKNGWSKEEAEKAFLGELEGYPGGSMDQFAFYNPQIAVGDKADELPSPSADGTIEIDDTVKNNTTLVIMTQGIMQYLSAATGEGDERYIMPAAEAPEGAKFKKGMGIYALSYGVGNQSIGKANISFTSEDFTAGAELSANLSFANTGDISIRGSEQNPITVALSVDGGGITSTKLASWEITENIVPGREVGLSGEFTLPMTLPDKAGFTLTISEDESYSDDPYSASLKDIYVVEKRKELGFEDEALTLSRQDNGKLSLDASGNAIIEVELFVGNRGLVDAKDVKLQFAYGVHDPALAGKVEEVKGEESGWNDVIYSALDITENTLVVGEEEELYSLNAAGGLTEGILSLGGIRAGYGRHVSGTITIPADKFMAFGLDGNRDPSGSLKLFVQIFCGDDETTTDVFGMRHVVNDEYNGSDNTAEALIEHTTAFVVPTKLELPAGRKLRLPVTFSTTLGSTEPDISTFEITDEEDKDGNTSSPMQNMDQTMDIVSYERSSYKNGIGSGTVVIRGVKEGNGYLRIQDAKTNSYQDIAILFTAPAEGIDIINSSDMFTFFDESGKTVKTSNNSWQFNSNANHYGSQGRAPHGGLLASGRPGTSFKFITEAETIGLYFAGEIIVASDFPGFTQVQLKGDADKQLVYFGANPENLPHTVTVTVKKASAISGDYADFDMLTEYYYGDTVDLTAWEAEEPLVMMWNAHFPLAHSLKANQVFEASILVVDKTNAKLSHTQSIDNKASSITDLGMTKISEGHYEWKVRFNGNGKAEFTVSDGAGNNSALFLDVDWWEEESAAAVITSGSPATIYYQKKYPDISLNYASALSAEDAEVVEYKWMSASYERNEQAILVYIEEDAPLEEMEVYCTTFKQFIGDTSPEEYLTPRMVKRGESTSFPVTENGSYIVLAGADKPVEETAAPDYKLIQEDGTVEEHSADEEYYCNVEYVYIGEEDSAEPSEAVRVPVVQRLEGNRLSFDQIEDGDALYLLKNGKYTYEDGLTVIPFAKNAVRQNTKNGRLEIKKDSMLTLKKGDQEKTVLLHAVTIRKKTVAFNSRKKFIRLSELFTEAGELMPDVKDGKYEVSVKKDNNGILAWQDMAVNKAAHISLADFSIVSTGEKGSATVSAVFGGVEYKVTVKCDGYPVYAGATGNIVNELAQRNAKGYPVLTFDAVENGDTLILLKNGNYALEAGVSIEPAAAYKNAAAVSENKVTGIRKLLVRKECVATLTKGAETKTILINLVNIKKKNVTLKKPGDSVTLAELFTEAYELLPDRTGEETYGGYDLSFTDKKGVLKVDELSFPGSPAEGDLSLNDFKLTHNGRKGSATVIASFGGKVFKVTVNCK